MPFTTNPEHAEIILKLETALSELSIGATIEYPELSAIADCDVQLRYRYLLQRARENAEQALGCIFESVRTVGIKRLNSEEMSKVGLAALRKTRRISRRGKRRLDRLNMNSMSEPEQRNTVAYRAMLGAVALISDGRRASAVAVVADPVRPIPPENILDMFRSR